MNAANQAAILAVQKDGYSGNAYQQVAIELQERLTLTEAAYKSLFERHEALQRENAHLIDTMKWIPVEQELPEFDTDVHLWAPSWLRVYLGYWRHSEEWIGRQRPETTDDLPDTNPTHWCPLPAPPKAEGGGE